MYKQYVRVSEAGIVIHGFSDAFEQPQEGDLLLSGREERHFDIPLVNDRGQHKYKIVDGAMVERTQEEIDAEWNNRPPVPPSLEDRLKATEDMLLTMLLGGM